MANLEIIKRNGKFLIQAQSPVLTGNLQQNAIQARYAYKGVLFYIDDNIGKYGAYLDDGKVPGKGQAHKNWWSERAYNSLQVWIDSNFNGKHTALRSAKKVVGQNKDSLARQVAFTRNIRRTGI